MSHSGSTSSRITANPEVRQVTIILNPAAGRGEGKRRQKEIEMLFSTVSARLSRPPRWEVVTTTGPGSGTALAAGAAARGADVVVAAGGDGTLGEVVNGLVETGARLGIIPLGTGNDFARTIGVAGKLERAIQAILQGTSRPVDLGWAQGRWFINVAGCGFDAVVAQRVNRGFRYLRGTAAYVGAVVQSLIEFKPAQMRLTIDGQVLERRAMLCAIANSDSYGGGMRIAPEAKIDDGLFDVCLLAEVGKAEFIRAFPRVFRGAHTTHPRVTMFRCRQIRVESEPALPVLIDGEVVGATPADFTIRPRVLEVMCP